MHAASNAHTAVHMQPPVDVYKLPTELRGLPKSITLYQYEVCPYCCKVWERAGGRKGWGVGWGGSSEGARDGGRKGGSPPELPCVRSCTASIASAHPSFTKANSKQLPCISMSG